MDREEFLELLRATKERLRARKLQAARGGFMADPSVSIEVKDLSDFVGDAEIILRMTEGERTLGEEALKALRPSARRVNIVL